MRKAWEELVETAGKRIKHTDSPHHDASAILWASRRMERLERVMQTAKAFREQGMIVFHTKTDCNCFVCVFDKALREVGEDG